MAMSDIQHNAVKSRNRFYLILLLIAVLLCLCGCGERQKKTAQEDFGNKAGSETKIFDPGPADMPEIEPFVMAEEAEPAGDVQIQQEDFGNKAGSGTNSFDPGSVDKPKVRSSVIAEEAEPAGGFQIQREGLGDKAGYRTHTFDPDSVYMSEVSSTVIAEAGYDGENDVLLLRFRSNGALYAYYDVDEYVYRDFLNAESKGTFFGNRIKDKYRYEKLESGGGYKVRPMYNETSYDRATYVVNNFSARFHTKGCRYADSGNIAYVSNSRSELEDLGYHACRLCLP